MNRWTVFYMERDVPPLVFDSFSSLTCPISGAVGPVLGADGAWRLIVVEHVAYISVVPVPTEVKP
jgi:hypothetical protein